MTLLQYIDKINTLYKTGNAREHSYRGDLQNLIMAILPDVLVTNEPARVACGAPDYVLTRKEIPIGYIEAKDIGVDLKDKKLKEQFDRYKAGLTNLIFTDYLDFHFYKDGEFVTKIAIAQLKFPTSGGVPNGRGGSSDGEIIPIPENFTQFANLIQNFAVTVSQTIKSPTKLAQMMAGKAKLMADVIEKSLNADDENEIRSSIKSQMLSFQHMLIHDIDNKSFADIYAQTIAYGMFAARYHDPTLPTFSREEAATLIPKSNPFLRKLFQDIAGYDLDNRLVWIVEELVSIFLASDVAQIMKNFGKSTKQEDPVVHFYETFLGEYNPALRKARGVWYTPQPVVNFIVRAVDDILKTEFGLKEGLADTSKIKIKKKAVTQTKGKDAKLQEVETEVEVHKVQILDPATGTGTFLAEVVKHIYKKFEGQQGIWSKYVTNDLIPRLNGFELLMASYAMAHLKMDMLLTETGYKPTNDQRFRIFLTNSLEEAHPDTQTLFSSWLSDEADQANAIKRDAPVMVVIGNPPYSVSSSNKSKWIESLTADYKKDLNERNIQPLSDDYIKFIRFGQYFIDKNGSGVLAYISNNSFIDGIIHRQMRKHLLESFDKIYILDLHGNTRIKEIALDGSVDQNVFDIMAGVSINIFVKTGKKFPSSGGVSEGRGGDLAQVFHYDLFGKRDFKYKFLSENYLKTIKWNNLNVTEPEYLMVNKDYSEKADYNLGFSINEMFLNNNSGLATEFDELVIHDNFKSAESILLELRTLDAKEIKSKYFFKDKQLIKIENAIKDIEKNKVNIYPINYRPFDIKYCIYTGLSNGIMGRPRNSTMQHFIKGKNVGIIVSRTVYGSYDWYDIQITDTITEKGIMAMRVGNAAIVCPLYIYPEKTNQQSLLDEDIRTPNLNMEIVNEIATKLAIPFVAEKITTPPDGHPSKGGEFNPQEFAPIDVLDYIYAVLHSPSYRSTYKEFLKIDFPRVPYPKDVNTFWQLVQLGGELRQIHLLESPATEKYITQYPEDGDNVVTKPRFVNSPPLEGCPKDGVVSPLKGQPENRVVFSSPSTNPQPDLFIKKQPIYYNTITDLPYNPELKPRAKALRYANNLSEVLFWTQVHKGHFYKLDFDRQRVIGNYIVDFYVKKLGLVIEIDGSSHDEKEAYDAQREAYLESLGLLVCRISVSDVLNNMTKALTDVEEFIIANYGVKKSQHSSIVELEKPPHPSAFHLEEKPPHPSGTPPEEGNLKNCITEDASKVENLGRVYINETQYFANVPEVAWNFYIGGYQPAQKWLKDRKERELSYEDVLHYQKIIVALTETNRIMKTINKIEL